MADEIVSAAYTSIHKAEETDKRMLGRCMALIIFLSIVTGSMYTMTQENGYPAIDMQKTEEPAGLAGLIQTHSPFAFVLDTDLIRPSMHGVIRNEAYEHRASIIILANLPDTDEIDQMGKMLGPIYDLDFVTGFTQDPKNKHAIRICTNPRILRKKRLME